MREVRYHKLGLPNLGNNLVINLVCMILLVDTHGLIASVSDCLLNTILGCIIGSFVKPHCDEPLGGKGISHMGLYLPVACNSHQDIIKNSFWHGGSRHCDPSLILQVT